ncbi:MAG: glycoside hydrolase [Bacillota bacterium]|nr:glycoside hydrolase [Bacillota bacterium]
MKKRILTWLIIFAMAITGINSFFLLYFLAADTARDSYLLYYNDQMLFQRGYYIENTPYLPVELIGIYMKNPGIKADEIDKRLEIDLSVQNIVMADETTTKFVKDHGGSVYIPFREIENHLYFPLNTTVQFFHMKYSVIGTTIRMYHDTLADTSNSNVDFYAPKKATQRIEDEKISLAWDYAGTITPSVPSQKYPGLDVLAPTWFHLITKGGGNVENNGDKGYTDTAHAKGYHVWATITNNMSTKGSTAFTTETFQNRELLNKSVAQYLFYSCLYDVDGINIDYEDVADEDAAGLVAFTALLRNYTERQGLILSIDTLIPRPWTIEYDRAALAEYVDYLAIMTYDEHYSGSKVAGSVASLPWVEEAVQSTLKDVPASKLLLGIPLYTRIWTVDSAGKVITNPAAKMPAIRSLIEEKALTPTWLDTEKQYYIEYPEDSHLTKIWIEDSRSISYRLNLITKYDLAGAACWQLRQGEETIWEVFEGMLKENQAMSFYQQPY